MMAFALAIIFTTAQSLEPLSKNGDDVLNKIIELLSKKPNNTAQITLAQEVFRRAPMSYSMPYRTSKSKRKDVLRTGDVFHDFNDEGVFIVDPQDKLTEEELKNSLKNKKSALHDHPYVETKGKSDFLVLRPDVEDPSVTVIPNAIYINAEKKCVNWLDDCSLKGIRNRLLRGVRSPYR